MPLINIEVSRMVTIALLIFSALVSCVLCVYIIVRSRSGKVMFFFISGQIMTIIWTVFYIFEILAPTVSIRWVIVCIEYLPLTFVGFAFMHFAYGYTRHKMMSRNCFFLTLLLPVFNYLSVLTNPMHHTFYSEFTLQGQVFGPITYLIMATTFTYLLMGAFFFLSREYTRTAVGDMQSTYFVIAIVIPVLIHLLDTFRVIQFNFSVTLIFIPFSVLLFIVSVLKYQFLDVLPVAINETIDGMLDGVLVVGKTGEVLDRNSSFFKRQFGSSQLDEVKTFGEFMEMIQDYVVEDRELPLIEDSLAEDAVDIWKGTFTMKTVYRQDMIVFFTVKPLYDYSKHKMATLITFFDMTDIYDLYRRLEEKNSELVEANNRLQNHVKNVQQLTMETERNKIMADIHDTLGHSMVELLTLLEVTDMIMEQQHEDVLDTVDEALAKGRNSLKEIREAVTKYKNMGGLT